MKRNFAHVTTACCMVLAAPLAAETAAITTGPEQVVHAAATFVEDTGSAERIESAEYLRTYTQEIAAAACFLYNDIDRDTSSALLIEARDGFEKHIDALLNGNAALGIIGGEERRKTIVDLEEINASWAPVASATNSLLATHDDSDAVKVIKSSNMPLFEMTNILVSNMEGQYSDPAALMQSDVLTLEILGRQSTMTQMIAKNACKIFTGNGSEEIKGALADAMQLYEVSMNALINGMPEVGILPAPTEEIAAGLKHVQSDWLKMRPSLNALLETGEMDRETQIEMFRHMADEMHELEEIMHAYALFSKH